ncbi:MAG: hypothetical protein ACK2T5_17550, partial [Anaerolineales bacterium]
LGEMIVMGLVLVLGGMIVGILIALPMIPIAIPLIMGIVGSASNETGGPVVSGLIFSGLCCAAYLPVLIVVGGIIRAYIGSAWTLTYLRLTRRPVEKSADLLLDELNNAIEDMDPKDPSAESETTDEIDEPADSTEDKAPDDTLPEDF